MEVDMAANSVKQLSALPAPFEVGQDLAGEFERQWQKCRKQAVSTVMRLFGVGLDQAQDFMMVGTVRMYQGWVRSNGTSVHTSFSGCLIKAAINVGNDWLRTKYRLDVSLDQEPENGRRYEPGAMDPGLEIELHNSLKIAYRSLPAPQREVLRYLAAGLSYLDICDITGWPLGTVKSRIGRARRNIIERMESVEARPLRSSARQE